MYSSIKKKLVFYGRKCLINGRDFFYPPLCILCDNPLSYENAWFCIDCSKKLLRNHSQRDPCPKCGVNRNKLSCSCDLVWDFYFESVFSFFDFDETVQKIAHHIKYKGKKYVAYYVGKRFAHLIPNEFLSSIDGVVSVPLHFWRKMKRGYNQAELMAKGIIEGIDDNLPYLKNVIKRKRNTKTQTKLDSAERRENLKNAFEIPPEKIEFIKNKNLLLVDDVLTTGATTDICAKELISAGAKSVRVISMARTV